MKKIKEFLRPKKIYMIKEKCNAMLEYLWRYISIVVGWELAKIIWKYLDSLFFQH